MGVKNNYKYIYKQRIARKLNKFLTFFREPKKVFVNSKSKNSRKKPIISSSINLKSLDKKYYARLGILIFFSLVSFLTILIVSILSSNRDFNKIVNNINISEIPYPVDRHVNDYLEYFQQGMGGNDLANSYSFADQLKTFSYTIKKGETLSEIAQQYNLQLGTLISFNNISDVRRIREGLIIEIPDRDGVLHEVNKGDNLESIAKKYKGSFTSMLDANNIQSDKIHPGQVVFIPEGKMSDYDLKRATGQLFVYPTVGRRTSPFGYRKDPFTGKLRMHYGLDLANRVGTPVIASMEGTVVYIGILDAGFGNYVLLSHANGYQTVYAHLNTISVRKGQWLSQGQEVGKMGNTGRSTGSHLHFGIYKNNIPVNPEDYLSR